MALVKPLLIFDGDCGFRRRWIERWKILTHGEVDYAPYQDVGRQFPAISETQFKKSVQLVEEGIHPQIYAGAEAVIRVLAHNASRKWLFDFYQKSALFRWFSEKFYEMVASHREFFSRLTDFLWGRDLRD